MVSELNIVCVCGVLCVRVCVCARVRVVRVQSVSVVRVLYV